ncbi:MAG: pirin family protein [Bacteroidetes bacterium]|nr:pirin family protein [Bacteroidota bacterium]
MNIVYHPADSRGHADHGWLDTYHSFSFASWHNPERMHFGALRVLNDDAVTGGAGFGTHPHDNMEIISIPLSGDLEHQDSMGNKTVIREGDVQIMSAGTGVMHSEKNHNADEDVRFLQIWVFPDERDLQPTYDQQTINPDDLKNRLHCIVSPNGETGVRIHQQAWFHMGHYASSSSEAYTLHGPGQGVYVLVLEGEARVEGQALRRRDALGVWNTHSFTVEVKEDTKLLLIEVPMQW